MDDYLKQLSRLLPLTLAQCVLSYRAVYEIRLRPGKKAVVVTESGRYACGPAWSEGEFEQIFLALAGGNRYKHESTLPCGYFTDIFGGRCGVACDITERDGAPPYARVRSLNVRVPRFAVRAADALAARFLCDGGRDGILIYGPPCSGKTTVIRALAGRLSAPPEHRCVCVCDERREFCEHDYAPDCNIDILSGYSKSKAMSVALRSLSPDVLICDEIDALTDADGVCALCGSGVPLIATVHARTAQELAAKDGVRMMREKGLFRTFARLTGHRDGVAEFDYTVV